MTVASALREMPPTVRLLAGCAIGALAVFVAYSLVEPWDGALDTATGAVLIPAVFVLCGVICFARAARGGAERTAWRLFGGAQFAEATGFVTFELIVAPLHPPPAPSVSDGAWLTSYALHMLAIGALLRARLRHLRVAPWADDPVVALTAAAIAFGFVLDGVVGATGGPLVLVAVNLAYPLADVILLVLLAVVFAVNRWRPAGVWFGIGAAIIAKLVADILYLNDVATATWQNGTILDAVWGLSPILIALAAWLPRAEREEGAGAESVSHAIPWVSTVAALGLLIYDHFGALSDVAAVLAWLALVAGALRTATLYAAARELTTERAALERTATTLRAAGEGIYMLDAAGAVTYANPATEQMLGYRPGELVGRLMHHAVHHTRADGSPHRPAECPISASLADGRERRVADDVFWRKDGLPVPVEYTVTPIVEDGAITGAATVFRDVTDRLRADRDARTQLAVTRVLAESIPVDEASERVIRAITEEMGFESARVLESGDADAGAGTVRMQIANGIEVIAVVEFVRSDRGEPDAGMLATLAAIGAQAGSYVARKRAESDAERLKNEFFALVSHELRTPLTSILGYLDIALEDEELSPQTRRALNVVDRNSARLLRLVGDLLFVAHVGAGEAPFERGDVDLRAVAADAVEAAGPVARQAGIELDADLADLPPVQGDAGRLAQAIDNMISNAIKFTPSGGRVCVMLGTRGDAALIEVRDTGIGIPPADRERIFERFFRSSAATERAIQGVGLGLTIVRAIVEGHGGSIEIDSVEGSGTAFRVLLPLTRLPTALIPAAD